MTRFVYKAIPQNLSQKSAEVSGVYEAQDEYSLRTLLREKGLILVEAHADRLPDLFRGWLSSQRLRTSDSVWFFQTFDQLLKAKLNAEAAIGTMADLAARPALTEACRGIVTQLRQGSALADAMAAYPGLAKREYLGLIRVAEASGQLSHVVALISRSLATRVEIRQTVIGRMIYPAILLIAALGALWFLSWFVIPRFVETLTAAGADLPLSTQFTLTFSKYLVYAAPVLLLLILFMVVKRPIKLSSASRQRVDQWLLKIPVFGSLFWHGQAVLITDILATILEGGGDVLLGLDQMEQVLWSEEIKRRVVAARERIREGMEIGEALVEHQVLPPMITAVVRAGGVSGDLVGALRRATDLAVEFQRIVSTRLLQLLEPAVILLFTGIVGWIIYSLVMGMLAVNDIGLT